jgi:hypothetical protein
MKQRKFEDAKAVTQRRRNNTMIKRKRTNRQTMIYKTLLRKTNDRAKRIPLKTGDELRCSGSVSSSCSKCDTHYAANPVISHE